MYTGRYSYVSPRLLIVLPLKYIEYKMFLILVIILGLMLQLYIIVIVTIVFFNLLLSVSILSCSLLAMFLTVSLVLFSTQEIVSWMQLWFPLRLRLQAVTFTDGWNIPQPPRCCLWNTVLGYFLRLLLRVRFSPTAD